MLQRSSLLSLSKAFASSTIPPPYRRGPNSACRMCVCLGSPVFVRTFFSGPHSFIRLFQGYDVVWGISSGSRLKVRLFGNDCASLCSDMWESSIFIYFKHVSYMLYTCKSSVRRYLIGCLLSAETVPVTQTKPICSDEACSKGKHFHWNCKYCPIITFIIKIYDCSEKSVHFGI